MRDELSDEQRLAWIYDPLDPDRSDLDVYVALVDELAKAEGLEASRRRVRTRTAVMGLFGMMNWLYTWYKPDIDPAADVLSREIGDIFLQGIRSDGRRSDSTNGGARNKSTSRTGQGSRKR